MLFTFLVFNLIILGIVLIFLDIKFWDTDIVTMIGSYLTISSGIILFIILTLIISINIDAPSQQALFEEQYCNLLEKVEHIELYNKEEVRELVSQWNYTYRQYSYGKQSPWLNWFYPCNLETVNLIKLK